MMHPSVEILIQHALGMPTVEAEHIAGCPECMDEVEDLASITAGAGTIEMPGALGDLESAFESERSAARAVLDGLSAEEVHDAMLSSSELRTSGGVQELLETIPKVRRKDPSRALAIAQDLVVTLEAGRAAGESALSAEMHADALREAGACARVLGRYDDALGCLADAEMAANEIPTGDYLLARIWYERAGLEVSREVSETREWATRASEVFVRFGDTRRYNRSRYLVAISHYNDRNFRQTARELNDLLPRLEADEDRDTQAAAWSVLGHALLKDDRAREASSAFSHALAAYESLDRPIDELRSAWGRARAHLKLGDPERGLESLDQVRRGFQSFLLDEETALVGLDMTEALILLNDHQRALAICRESMQTLNDRFHGHGQKRALAYLAEIATSELDVDNVRHVSAYLFDSISHPELPFSSLSK